MLAFLVTAYGLLRMARFASPRHALPRVASVGAYDVTAVVPARDEAGRVGACVTALLATGVREVVVVDDGSSDATAAVAAGAGARVVTAPQPAPGALGKPSACAAGAAAATGAWLWFVDADVVVAPDALARLLACEEPFVSALGTVEGSGWLMPEVGFGLARRLDLDAVADPTSPAAFAAGPCLLVRRDAYDALGGHAAVREEVAEDVALARLAKLRGVPLRLALAPDAYRVATYGSLRETWRGLRKNSASVRRDPAVEAMWAAAALAPLLLLRRRRSRRLAALTLGLQVLTSAGGRIVARAPVLPAVGAPVAELVLAANWLASRRGAPVAWRGREVRPR